MIELDLCTVGCTFLWNLCTLYLLACQLVVTVAVAAAVGVVFK